MASSIPITLTAESSSADELSDRSLLMRFIESKDHDAFAVIVARYHHLVFGVCYRLLANRVEAEEAYQATFLVLARRAASLRWQEWISGWLYQTAYRTALRHRRKLAVDAKHQRIAASFREDVEQTDIPEDQKALARELGEVLDEELMRLPDALRLPLQLQLLEGLDRSEIAQRLGISIGAVKDRLERCKSLLRVRLQKRGIAYSLAAFGAWLGTETSALAASAFTQSTAQAAVAFASGGPLTGLVSTSTVSLAQGVLGMYIFSKIKWISAGIASAILVTTAAYGWIVDQPDRFERSIRGFVESVDRQASPPRMVLLLDEFEVPLSLDIDPKVSVREAFTQSDLEGVKPGTYVGVKLKDDHRTIGEIHALGKTMEVAIVAVSGMGLSDTQSNEGTGRTLTVRTESDDDDDSNSGRETTIGLADRAILRIGGLPAHIAHLHPGLVGRIEFGPKSDRIHCVELEASQEQMIEGVIVESGPSLTVDVEIDDVLVRKEYRTTSTSQILHGTSVIDASQLLRGQSFRARVSPGKPEEFEALIITGQDDIDEPNEANDPEADDDHE
jgi:RNA polymerase sigma factor (sigma-70 family)